MTASKEPGLPADVRLAIDFTREDLGPDDGRTNYPHIRCLLRFAEAALASGRAAVPSVPFEMTYERRLWNRLATARKFRDDCAAIGAEADAVIHGLRASQAAPEEAAPEPTALTASLDKTTGCVVIHNEAGDVCLIVPDGKMAVARSESECDECKAVNLEFARRVVRALATKAEGATSPAPPAVIASVQSDGEAKWLELGPVSWRRYPPGTLFYAAEMASAPSSTVGHDTAGAGAPPSADDRSALQEQIDHLRAHLRSVTDAYEALLDDGEFPAPRNRSADERESLAQWWEDSHNRVKLARKALEHPEDAPQHGQRGNV